MGTRVVECGTGYPIPQVKIKVFNDFSKQMMEEIPSPEGKFVQISFRTVLKEMGIERTVDHLDVAFLPHGHEDFPEPHWDVHAYFFSRKEVAKLTKRVK